MAKDKNQKLVPIKITANVAWRSKVLKKDSIVEVSEEDAALLIEEKHAMPAPAKAAA